MHHMTSSAQAKRHLTFATLAALAASAPQGVHAETSYWTGAGATDNWSNPFNWDDVRAPLSNLNDTFLYFYSVVTRTHSDVNNDWSVNGLEFGTEVAGFEQSFTLASSNGSTLTVGSGGIANFSAATQTIDVPIALGAEQWWRAVDGNLVFNGARSGAFDLGLGAGESTRVIFLGGSGTAHTGLVYVESGVVRIGNVDAISAASLVIVKEGAVFDLANTPEDMGGLSGAGTVRIGTGSLGVGQNNTDSTFSGALTGSGTFNKLGTGRLTLSGNNAGYSGTVNVLAGTLEVGVGDSLGNGSTVSVSQGTTLHIVADEAFGALAGAGTVDLDANMEVGNNNASTLFSGAIIGTGNFTKAGNGTMKLTGVNTFDGTVTVNRGTLTLGAGDTLGGQSVTVNAGGVLLIEDDAEDIARLSGDGNVILKQNLGVSVTGPATNFSGRITGNGNFTKLGPGTLRLSGRNTFDGEVFVNGGILELGAGDTLSNAHAVTVNPGNVLRIVDDAEDFGSLAIRAGGLELVNQNLRVGFNNASTRLDGFSVFVGTGNFTKTGNGTMTVDGAMLLAGTVAVTDGKLDLQGRAKGFDGAVVAGAGTLRLGSSVTVDGTVENLGRIELSAGTLTADTLDLRNGLAFDFTGGKLDVGQVLGSLTNVGGVLSSEGDAARTTVFGDYTQQALGTLEIDLLGDGAASGFDLVGGRATLAGKLSVRLATGATLRVGDMFDILTADGGIHGDFTLLLPTLTSGRQFSLDRSDASRLRLVVTAPAQTPVPLPPALLLLGSALITLRRRQQR